MNVVLICIYHAILHVSFIRTVSVVTIIHLVNEVTVD